MKNFTASISVSTSETRPDLVWSIRDSIFYYDDLMGKTEVQPKATGQEMSQEGESELIMNVIFDEAMFENQYSIRNTEREQKIQHLLKSIESFQVGSLEEE